MGIGHLVGEDKPGTMVLKWGPGEGPLWCREGFAQRSTCSRCGAKCAEEALVLLLPLHAWCPCCLLPLPTPDLCPIRPSVDQTILTSLY